VVAGCAGDVDPPVVELFPKPDEDCPNEDWLLVELPAAPGCKLFWAEIPLSTEG